MNEVTESNGSGSVAVAEDMAQELPSQAAEMEPRQDVEEASYVPEERRADAPRSGPVFSPHQADLIIVLLLLLLFMYLSSQD